MDRVRTTRAGTHCAEGLGRNKHVYWLVICVSISAAHLDMVAEAFNLLYGANVAEANPVFVQPGFLLPLAGAGAQKIQF
jgi:hypothetical protein